MNLVTYFKALKNLYREIKIQKRFNETFLKDYISSLETQYGGHFRDDQLKKIYSYYGLFIPAVLCSSFKKLYGQPFTEDERKRATLFGILTPVGDDLFDIDNLDTEAIKKITYRPHEYVSSGFTDAVAKEIQATLLNLVPHRDDYLKAAQDVFEIQTETSRQLDASITDDELQRITFDKGGYSVLIYHSILDNKATDEMRAVLYHIGALMQLTNDIFDMHKDLNDRIVTLPNRCADFSAIKSTFLKEIKETNKKIYTLPFPKAQKENFSITMNFIISRGVVAMDKMIGLEKKMGKPLPLKNLSRQNLVCDMQKPKNIARWLYYIYRIPKMK